MRDSQIPSFLAQEIQHLAYRERIGLSWQQMGNEPHEEVARALYIWSLQSERDKLDTKRNETRNG